MEDRRRNDALLIIGVIVMLVGLALLGQTLNIFPPFVFELVGLARRATGPLALIILGAIVILVAARGVRPSMPATGVKLYRSRTDRWIAGVAGGLGKYFDVDPLIVRLVFVVVGLLSFGTALVAYIVLAVLVPEEPPSTEVQQPNV